ncbi:sialate O-acetylesterase [Roseimarinus sediminis]|uniref:sialate O-acetylesterase n=1 Tax=Roseimarinus sediminis TaxID=1610899 RepID=UPI003D1D42B9
MKSLFSTFRLIFTLLIFSTVTLSASVRLPRLVSNNMVLQRDVQSTLWGWADTGETLTLTFNNKSYETKAGNDGKWSIELPPQAAGGPFNMTFSGDNEIEIKNILFGDVWICSGQSNMELNMERVGPLYPNELANANYPNIRYFQVNKTFNFTEAQEDIEAGEWQHISTENIRSISATSYFFGKALYERYQVPIGLINTALGGSPAEAWLSEEALREFPKHHEEAMRFKNPDLINEIRTTDQQRSNAWYRELYQKDLGSHDPKGSWHSASTNTGNWDSMQLPGYWADEALGYMNGVVWFRKTITLSEQDAGKAARLLLGRIIDADSVFINGQLVGTTSYQYPPRRYSVPENVLKAGENTITVRVISNAGRGGFQPDKPYQLIIGENEPISLEGQWKYKAGAKMDPLPGPTFIRWKPGGLYNAMIHPLTPMAIKGVIWYQGESNADNPEEYARLFPTLINDWRKNWEQGVFPFLFVQLPNYMEEKKDPSESGWARTREAQAGALALPNTGMAVVIDIGEWNDIHPLNKKDIGERLALQARCLAYGEKKLTCSGPQYRSMKTRGNKIILSFEKSKKRLISTDQETLRAFAIAGSDKEFVWAKARIKGNKVIVWNDEIDEPVAVRYAWADNPGPLNFYNEAGLPAAPFRTDRW